MMYQFELVSTLFTQTTLHDLQRSTTIDSERACQDWLLRHPSTKDIGSLDAKAEVSLPEVNPICRGQLRQRIIGPQRYSERI
jgi:hypothetical protein